MFKNNRLFLVVLSGALVIAGCQTTGDEKEPFAHRLIKPGAVLVLERAVTIRRDSTTVYIQDGTAGAAANTSRPYCTFEVNTLMEKPRQIVPDRFAITRVNWGTSQIQAQRAVMVAQLGGDSGMPMHLYYRTELNLSSERQPDVTRMICEVDRVEAGGMSFQSYLTLSDVRSTLDGLFRLELVKAQ